MTQIPGIMASSPLSVLAQNLTFTTDGVVADIEIVGGLVTVKDSASFAWHKADTTTGAKTSGKNYYEMYIDTMWSSDRIIAIGVADRDESITSATGSSNNAGNGTKIQYFESGETRKDGTYVSYGATFSAGDYIGVSVDYDVDPGNVVIVFYKNGVSQGDAYTVATSYFTNGVVPHLCVFNDGDDPVSILEYKSYTLYLPSGYSAWGA